ncbi:hypothetical protein HY374_04195 [Candidatus Berkelbacteria bacterium]|nr:hypothetical protein [Candidatus Berkelbacteria bacterium]
MLAIFVGVACAVVPRASVALESEQYRVTTYGTAPTSGMLQSERYQLQVEPTIGVGSSSPNFQQGTASEASRSADVAESARAQEREADSAPAIDQPPTPLVDTPSLVPTSGSNLPRLTALVLGILLVWFGASRFFGHKRATLS